MIKETKLKNIILDETKSIELNKFSVLVVKGDDISVDIINELKQGLGAHLGFNVPIIAMDNDSDIEDIGVEPLIKILAIAIKEKPELLNDLKKEIGHMDS